MKPTIKDVANRAGVAISTVSRVLNNRDKVSGKTKEKVLNAVQDLHYQPDMVAQSLKSKQTNTIGVVLEDISLPISTGIIKGLDSVASQNNFNLFLCDGDSSQEKVLKHFEALENRKVDGIIYSSSISPAADIITKINAVCANSIPVVGLTLRHPELPICTIFVNPENEAELAVRHLVRLGHRRIALVTNYRTSFISKGNAAAYQRILSGLGLYDEKLVRYSEYSGVQYDMKYREFKLMDAERITYELLDMDDPPTAVYATGDLLAFGILSALRKRNIDVPGRISVIGCCVDDLFMSISPVLSTVYVPYYDMAKTAMENLIGQIKSGPSGSKEITLDSKLIDRGTCGYVL